MTREESLTGDYAAVFLGTEAGQRVYADLLAKFDPRRPCFDKENNVHGALRTQGRQDVMREIQSAMARGAERLGIPFHPEDPTTHDQDQ